MISIVKKVVQNVSGVDDTCKSFDKIQFDDCIKDVEGDALQSKFKNAKLELIAQWEKNTGQKWPTYLEDVVSAEISKVVHATEKAYDAHHLILNSYGGDISWWNIHPASNPLEHQGGIHGAGSIANEIFK